MRPGLAMIIEKVGISRYFEPPETDLNIAEEACWIDYADIRSSNRVRWLSKCESPHRATTDSGSDDLLELDTGVAWVSPPSMRIHQCVAPTSKIQWLLATLLNTGRMDHCQVPHWSFGVILILDLVDVEEAYSHIALRYYSLQWHVQSYAWHYASFG